jgi:N-glycosylase/DNA lyase
MSQKDILYKYLDIILTMENLIQKIEQLKKSQIAEIVNLRIKEFEKLGKEKEDDVFSELCFCLLTANFQAEKCIKIQKEMGRDFLYLPEDELAKKLKEVGHRFWPQRAERIVKARDCKTELCSLVMKESGKEMREWLVENVKGLGMKESSHFLRNIGYKDVAIIDFHIIDILADEGLIEKNYEKEDLIKDDEEILKPRVLRASEINERSSTNNKVQQISTNNKSPKIILNSKSLTPKKYLEIEQVLDNLGKKVNLNLAELDLYLWYLETGKILK